MLEIKHILADTTRTPVTAKIRIASAWKDQEERERKTAHSRSILMKVEIRVADIIFESLNPFLTQAAAQK